MWNGWARAQPARAAANRHGGIRCRIAGKNPAEEVAVQWNPTGSHMSAPSLQLSQLIDFDPDQGTIRLHQQRVVILSAAAMGLLRKEIIETIGAPTARRLLMRFGYADGYHDAVTLRDRSTCRRSRSRRCATAPSSTRWRASSALDVVRADYERGDRVLRGRRVAEFLRGRAARPSLRPGRGAGVLVAGRLHQRIRQRLPWSGGLLPRAVVPGAGRHGAARSRAWTRTAGATPCGSAVRLPGCGPREGDRTPADGGQAPGAGSGPA